MSQYLVDRINETANIIVRPNAIVAGVGGNGRLESTGVFAVGDARRGSGKRVAAAVGEGSATVSAVHEYLRTV